MSDLLPSSLPFLSLFLFPSLSFLPLLMFNKLPLKLYMQPLFLLLFLQGFRVRPILAIILSVVLSVISPIVFTVIPIVALTAHADLVQYDPQNTASGFIKLVFYFLCKAVTDRIVFYHQYGAVTVPCNNGSVYHTSQRRCIDDNIGKRLSQSAQHFNKFPASEKFAWIRRHRPCKKHMQFCNIRFTYCIHKLVFSDQTVAQPVFYRACLISPDQYRFTHIRID